MKEDGDCGQEVMRVQVGWRRGQRVLGIICDRKVSARLKENTYITILTPAEMYSLETTGLTGRCGGS